MRKNSCESCGMPLKDKVRGQNPDGSPSQRYCNLCYQDGKFVSPDCTVQEMVEIARDGMAKNGWPRPIAKLLTRGIPRLPRWQQDDTSKPVED